ncbi:peptidase G2 autoproteolytic cleavage domain-containing protein [Leisingera sp. M523]|uniref:peptidase G2 autoproteolytic cleavage domain-containing protein n=1 Tax=Leisingera sp. M523 TaxID=2867013 RepID=UPI0021A2F7DC|nr:peptidase G2 autoproteolytic cleavage domain-containing protein [Leisingera sp. M523]UWQ29920.1 hypothetical protein K3557_05060 [Leisingera sp. M523]
MYALFQHFAVTLRSEMQAYSAFLEGIDAADFFSVQGSWLDATLGKVLTAGAFGWGHDAANGSANTFAGTELSAITITGLYRYASTHTDAPSTAGVVMHLNRIPSSAAGGMVQVAFGNNGEMWTRPSNGIAPVTFSAWQRIAIDGQSANFLSAVIGQGQASDIPLALYSSDSSCFLSLNDGATSSAGSVAVVATGDDLKLRAGGGNHVTILDGGNVGVGVGVPVYRLDANGTMQVIESDDQSVSRIANTNSSFSKDLSFWFPSRAASPDWNFLLARSGGGSGDAEFKLSGDGLGSSDLGWQGGGADYAEYFEWDDGNPNGEDRRGLSVVLVGSKIRPAQSGENPIGVVSANPSVVGDGDMDRWKGKYLRDEFNATLWEDYDVLSWIESVSESETVREQATEGQRRSREVIEVVGGEAVRKVITETIQVPLFDEVPLVDQEGNSLGTHRAPRMADVQRETTKEVQHSYAADEVPEGVIVPADAKRVIQKRRKLNPDYHPGEAYTPRADRLEWDTVGLMGKLRLCYGQPIGDRWIKMRDISADVEEWLVR